ncbi:FAD binding protein [Nitzschia inconspicua]|uniref:FAD binding protein n=1 Tax=Nitzschia inconspicua TaxID=303405 RepID=A0A9K3PAI5_9STRA|nr:FAD binding protein [Nitzschia inconspicua]KAG7362571.1 FAD binding protein [Nitzschia inconspicua]
MDSTDVVVCGGGPTGLLCAMMLSQKFPHFQIQLYDEQPTPPPTPTDPLVWGSNNNTTNLDRFYLIGLGGRGITSLEELGVWDSVQRVAVPVPGRKDWNGKGVHVQPIETFKTERKYVTQVLPRDKLVSVLYHHIRDCQINNNHNHDNDNNNQYHYSYSNIDIQYGCKVEPVDMDRPDGSVTISFSSMDPTVVDTTTATPPPKQQITTTSSSSSSSSSSLKLSTPILIAADGSARTFANAMEQQQQHDNNNKNDAFRVIRYNDDNNQRVYKNIAFSIPNDWRKDMNYAVRTDRVIFDALPANHHGDYVGVLLLSKNDDMARSNVDPNDFRTFLNDHIPQFIHLIDDATIAKVAKRSPSTLPMFRYVTPRMHHDDGRIVLLGDCAHTVKPYFGMGANSALEDVKLLSHFIDKHQQQHKIKGGTATNTDDDDDDDDKKLLKQAIQDFSTVRSPDIKVLVEVSHSLDGRGLQGIVFFLIPIILDGIFFKVFPQVFAPNIISMLQNEEITFQEAVTRKRMDRIGQISILAAIAAFIKYIVDVVVVVATSTMKG